MRKLLKKEKGITLVALVVTIIILLILAGITISQLTGSGLFEKAQLAEQKSKNAQEKEEEMLEDYMNLINGKITTSNREPEEEKGYFNFKEGKTAGFTATIGTINNHSLGIIPEYANENVHLNHQFTCKLEKELEKSISLNKKFEISTDVNIENSASGYMGGIIIKMFQKTENNYTVVGELNLTDAWAAVVGLSYSGMINDITVTKNFYNGANTYGSPNASGRWALIGDGEKIYIYRDNIKYNEIACTESITIDKIEIYFLRLFNELCTTTNDIKRSLYRRT